MDNNARARFITSLGSLNGYGSTVLQTKKALDAHSTAPLRQDANDIAIFTDALKGIKAIQETGFSADGIIATNRQFDSPSAEQPKLPGHLRNAYYNEDDRTAIVIDEQSNNAYFPPDVVTKADLDQIVTHYETSQRQEIDAWHVFASIAKLQPFQDGNKRTALIAANAAYDTFATQNYLVLPFNDLDRVEFTVGLMRYYQAETPAKEARAFEEMMATLPTAHERELALRRPIDDGNGGSRLGTVKIKPQLRFH
ncbi:Fic family protein [Lacticaseibacillus saniviri]